METRNDRPGGTAYISEANSGPTVGSGKRTMSLPYLAEELIFKIIARLPYPDIIRVRCVSKRWCQLLSGDSSDCDSKVLQAEVRRVCSAWPRYTPLQIQVGRLVGYDARAEEWSTIPTQWRTKHQMSMEAGTLFGLFVRASGSLLMCWHNPYGNLKNAHGQSYEVTVANIFTGKFKHLKAPPLPKEEFDFEINEVQDLELVDVVFDADTDNFIIVIIYDIANQHFHVMLHVYESRTARWYTDFIQNEDWEKTFHDHNEIRVRACPVLGQRCMVKMAVTNAPYQHSLAVVDYNVLTKRWGHVVVGNVEDLELQDYRIVLCGSRVLVVGWDSDYDYDDNGDMRFEIFIFEFSEGTQEVALVNRSQIRLRQTPHEIEVASDEQCVYSCWGRNRAERDVLVFRLSENTWTRISRVSSSKRSKLQDGGDNARRSSEEQVGLQGGRDCFHLVPSTFAPGLNPFFDPSASEAN